MSVDDDADSIQRCGQVGTQDSLNSMAVIAYQLGVRIGQCRVLHRRDDTYHPESINFVRTAVHWLNSSLLSWGRMVTGERVTLCEGLVRELLSDLKSLERLNGDTRGYDIQICGVGQKIDEVAMICGEIVKTELFACKLQLAEWIELGIEIVDFVDCRPNSSPFGRRPDTPFKADHNFRMSNNANRSFYEEIDWSNARRIEILLTQLCIDVDQLYPEAVDTNEIQPTPWADLEGMPCWDNIECGLRCLQEAAISTLPNRPANKTASDRPAYRRDHLWLEWYEDKSLDTHESPAKIRARWNQLSEGSRAEVYPKKPERVSDDVVKKGLKKARSEREVL